MGLEFYCPVTTVKDGPGQKTRRSRGCVEVPLETWIHTLKLLRLGIVAELYVNQSRAKFDG